MSHDFVPLLHSLDTIYAPASRTRETVRWNDLKSEFQRIYDRPVDFIARAPGRVNLIGEYVFG